MTSADPTWAEVKARCRAENRRPTTDEILACQHELARIFEEWEPQDDGDDRPLRHPASPSAGGSFL